jgi:hypothetical protein
LDGGIALKLFIFRQMERYVKKRCADTYHLLKHAEGAARLEPQLPSTPSTLPADEADFLRLMIFV